MWPPWMFWLSGGPYTVRVSGGDESHGLQSGAQHSGWELHGGGGHSGEEAHDGFNAARMAGVPQGSQGEDHVRLIARLQALHGHVQQRLQHAIAKRAITETYSEKNNRETSLQYYFFVFCLMRYILLSFWNLFPPQNELESHESLPKYINKYSKYIKTIIGLIISYYMCKNTEITQMKSMNCCLKIQSINWSILIDLVCIDVPHNC